MDGHKLYQYAYIFYYTLLYRFAQGLNCRNYGFLFWKYRVSRAENFVKYIVVAVDRDIIDAKHLPNHLKERSTAEDSMAEPSYRHGERTFAEKGPLSILGGFPLDGYSWQEVEKAYAIHVLEKNRWIVTRAANEAGVKRSTFVARMRRLGIRKS